MTPPMAAPPGTPSASSSAAYSSGGGTRVVLPPLPSPGGTTTSRPSTTTTNVVVARSSTAISADPHLLLDAFDAYITGNRSKNSSSSNNFSQSRRQSGNASTNNETGAPTSAGGSSPDPIDFLNQHYSSEALLVAQLPFVRDAVTDRMNRLDDRISTALQRQSESAEATQQHVQDAKASVSSLEKRICQVQQTAHQSEQTVREITKDMKRLDCAKRHLQRTITTLKRLHMLIHAVEQLRLACLLEPFPDYKTASHLVDAIRLLLKHFDAYQNKVEPMKLLHEKVTSLQGELKYTLIRGFRVVNIGVEATNDLERDKKNKYKSLKPPKKTSTTPDGEIDEEDDEPEPPIMTPQVMTDGIVMMDALGRDARNEFISVFGSDQLSEYSRIFKPVKKEKKEKPRVSSFKVQAVTDETPSKPEFALEFIEKRFLWFRNMLATLGQKYPNVFPPYWNMEYLLTKTFLKRTRGHLLALLQGATRDPDAGNATILLKALQKTIQFEKEVSVALQREYGTKFKDPSKKEGDKGKSTTTTATTTPSKSKNTPAKKGKGGARGGSSQDESMDDGMASKEQEEVEPLFGLASSAFDNFMGPYIALEEESMDEELVKALEDRTVDTRGELPVYTTSTKLFVYIKGSVTRCTALTKGNAFFLLYQAFQDSLRKYAQVLSSKLPPPLPRQNNIAGGLGLQNMAFAKKEEKAPPAAYKVPQGEEVTVCHVIGTCEYCADTVEALEDLIRDTIDEEYKEKIDMMGQQEAFHDITAKAIGILVSGLENRLEDAYQMMTGIDWEKFYEVGEESDYVRYMQRAIEPYVTTARGLIPTSYFRSVCDKFALAFTNTYYETLIHRLKTISEPGSQQLLLDVLVLKTLFLKLPVLEKSSGAASPASTRSKTLPAATTIAPAMYTKMVQKQFKKIEILLKLAGTPVDLLVDVFREQWVGGSALDLQTVMSLKGMKRNEQASMLEKFGLDPAMARKGAAMNVTSATIVSERFQAVQGQAGRVNSDLKQMRQRVDDFRRAFR